MAPTPPRIDGRLVYAAVLAVYGLLLFSPNFNPSRPHWARMGIADRWTPSFVDLRSVTSAWKCTREGRPVLVSNPCDPFRRPANYPGIWLKLSHLGLGPRDTTVLGIGLALLFFGSVLLLMGRCSALDGLVYGGLMTAPAVMLGVNRGNVDDSLFVLLVTALAALARPRLRVLGAALVELAAFLKLFPVFASVALLHARRRWALAAFAPVVVVFAVYGYWERHELATIRRVVPRGQEQSFGPGVIVGALRQRLGKNAPLIDHRVAAVVVVVAVAVVAAAALTKLLLRTRHRDPESSTRLPWLWAGGGVVAGTWMFTENSYDYRLAFAVLAVPQLLEWTRQRRPAVPFPRLALALVLACVWLNDKLPLLGTRLNYPWIVLESHFPFDEILVVALVAYFLAALALTPPAWFRRALRVVGPEPGADVT
jgi:hypothetical protein